MEWINLTQEEKENYKRYCDDKYGKTIIFCETGEPMYLDKKGHMIVRDELMDILMSKSTIKN